MADIRPTSGQPFSPPAVRPADTARTAAQRAFFQAAVGRASGAVEAAAPQAAASVVRTEPRRVEPVQVKSLPEDADASPRYLRPGSLLDIKV